MLLAEQLRNIQKTMPEAYAYIQLLEKDVADKCGDLLLPIFNADNEIVGYKAIAR